MITMTASTDDPLTCWNLLRRGWRESPIGRVLVRQAWRPKLDPKSQGQWGTLGISKLAMWGQTALTSQQVLPTRWVPGQWETLPQQKRWTAPGLWNTAFFLLSSYLKKKKKLQIIFKVTPQNLFALPMQVSDALVCSSDVNFPLDQRQMSLKYLLFGPTQALWDT